MAYDVPTRERLVADMRQIMSRYPQERSALLPMLHLVQAEEGYVSPDGIALCAELLGLTAAEVSAVATFYTQYKRHPNGEYTVGVCTNTLCAVLGGDAIYEALSEHLGVGHDETTEDGSITLERIECNAACDYAPVMMVNWEFFDRQTPESARDVVDRLRAGQDVAPTRGAAKVCTFKEVSRVLAGFPDGRADEGVGAGDATLRGNVVARQQGWTPERGVPAGGGRDGAAGGGPALAAGQQPPRERTSAHDAPSVPAGEDDRGGAPAGKPSGDTTAGPQDEATGTEPTEGTSEEG
ncbi:NADH-quinone oxidoreductase subunit NuoE [Quadrisphaera sp. GCM10027208]|uniref:NADH-quinone oxidoreductase subunit NuoE n=1 Tax=Quadrisphaera sp. GCM10027208 TaxID=3273423 RepID=UPI0036203C25